MRAGTNIGVGVRPGVGVGIGRGGIYIGPGWRYGGYHAGVYYPGRFWRNGAFGYGYPGYYGYGNYGYGDGYYYSGPYVAAQGQARADVAYSGPGVTIRNNTDQTVNFLLDGEREMSIGPGETVRLTEYADFQVGFNRGDNLGDARYTIYEGTYEFTPTDNGWELYRQKDAAVAAEAGAEAEGRTAERPMTPAAAAPVEAAPAPVPDAEAPPAAPPAEPAPPADPPANDTPRAEPPPPPLPDSPADE